MSGKILGIFGLLLVSGTALADPYAVCTSKTFEVKIEKETSAPYWLTLNQGSKEVSYGQAFLGFDVNPNRSTATGQNRTQSLFFGVKPYSDPDTAPVGPRFEVEIFNLSPVSGKASEFDAEIFVDGKNKTRELATCKFETN